MSAVIANALIANRVLRESKGNEIISKLNEIDQTDLSLKEVLSTVAGNVHEYDLDVVNARDQETGESVYILVNKEASEAAKRATLFDAGEIELFKAILDILYSPKFNRPKDQFSFSMGLIRDFLDDEIKKRYSYAETKYVIERLVNLGWLTKYVRQGDEIIAPSLRTLAELNSYLQEQYGQDGTDTYRKCAGCNQVFTIGRQCTTEECRLRLHNKCAEIYFRGRDESNQKCGLCGADFTTALTVHPLS